jgi:hypothetical protein
MDLMTHESALVHIPTLQLRALVILVQEIFSQIDEVASLTRRGAKAQLSRMLLQEMCSVIREFSQPLLDAYYEVLSATGVSRSAQVVAEYGDEFVEHSAPSKRQLIAKIRNDLHLKAA